MKALLRWGIGLFGILLTSSLAHAWVWVSPVTKCPLGYAPDLRTAPQYYFYGTDGRLYGPYYNLVPPFPPERGFLPGPIGRAIQTGTLSHELLMCKEAMILGDMPLLKNAGRREEQKKEAPEAPDMDRIGSSYGGGGPYGGGPYGGAPYGGMSSFGTMPPPGMMPPATNTQVPYMGQPAPVRPMPYAAGINPYSMPYASQPGGYRPLNAPPMAYQQAGYIQQYAGGGYGYVQRDPVTGIWLVQNIVPNAPPPPPSNMPPMGAYPPRVIAPPQGYPYPPPPPMPGYERFSTMQPPQPPMPPRAMMDLPQPPRMDGGPPPAAGPATNAYPTHPFVRSPRDFFMWGDVMADERARGNRPNPVP